MRRRKQTGMTLTEVMVTTAIFTFILGGLYTTMIAGNLSWQNFETAIKVQREARKAIISMARDLRASTGLSISTNTGYTVTFTQPDIGNTVYTWTDTGSTANQLIRTIDTGNRIIAQDISAISVTETSTDITISVTSTAQSPQAQSESFQLTKKVAKR